VLECMLKNSPIQGNSGIILTKKIALHLDTTPDNKPGKRQLINLKNCIMKSNELRIGNLVYDKQTARVITITISWMKQAGDRLKPIPLTKEWLKRFGFEQQGSYFDVNGINIDVAITKTDVKFGVSIDEGLDYFYFEYERKGLGEQIVKINHVHQLQNLYFALTGEELKIEQ